MKKDQSKPKKRTVGVSQPSTNRNNIQDGREIIAHYPAEKNKTEVPPLNDKSKYNVFLIIGLKKDCFKRANISFYYEKDPKFDYNILNVNDNNKNITGELILIQIELDKRIKELMIKINSYKIKLKITYVTNNYFCFKDIGYGLGKGSNILEVKKDIIFEEFLEYFYSKSKPAENIEIKQDMLEAFSKIECENFLNYKNNFIFMCVLFIKELYSIISVIFQNYRNSV